MTTRPAPPATVLETHTAILFFLGDRVYKMKKPVNLGFLDFSSAEARAATCRREVEINRRFAPDVYLGTASISDEAGRPCEELVVMKRMPDDRRLATLVSQSLAEASVEHAVREVARRVSAIHGESPTSPEIAAAGRVEAVRGLWEANAAQMRRFAGGMLDPREMTVVDALAHRYLSGRPPLFAHRIATGRIRDGHGDLLAEDIFCLDDGPRILDCLEFDDRLRWGDVLADVAFLAMDLERLGAPELARRFLYWYREFSAETYPASLADHYIAYRAQVRAKVACIRAEQGRPASAVEARRLLRLARHHLEQGAVTLLLVGGLPGTGKSTLAAGLSDSLAYALIRSDEVRKDLAGLPHQARVIEPYEEGLYSPESTAATYTEMLHRARTALELGESVVLDATFSSARWREEAGQMAAAVAADVVALRCVLPSNREVERRIAERLRGVDPSDASPSVARAMARSADPWPSANRIDTAGGRASALNRALAEVAKARRRAVGQLARTEFRLLAGAAGAPKRAHGGRDQVLAAGGPLSHVRPGDRR
ncbi:MAG TPA: AAA family ATPase [Candidatus Limnocylindrales bacterium]|nr:AAA family ATPase [Candidatus Limnocylindrales bacterium]